MASTVFPAAQPMATLGQGNLLDGLGETRVRAALTQASDEAEPIAAGRVRFREVAFTGKTLETATQHGQGYSPSSQRFIRFGPGSHIGRFRHHIPHPEQVAPSVIVPTTSRISLVRPLSWRITRRPRTSIGIVL